MSGEPGPAHLRPPEQGGKRRLRRDTFAVVGAIYAYVKTQPSSSGTSVADHQQTTTAMQKATSEEEKNAIWNENTQRVIERSEREGRELAERFGGQTAHLATEYQRLRMLSEQEVRQLDWESGSLHWIVSAAKTLERLAREL